MQDFANLCNVHSYISVSQLASREIQAFVVKLFSINNPKEQTAKSNTHRVYQVLEVSAFPPALGHTQGQGEGLQLPWRAQHALPAPANVHGSLDELLLPSPWADPTQQQLCNTCCSHICHLNPQITFGNLLENCQPFFPMGISSEELSRNCCLEGSSGGHLL